MCAKLIHHAQIRHVYYLPRGYDASGVEYLRAHGVDVTTVTV
jgi:tRNA(Arg) A34 adenosine deaminase TadA